MPRVPEPQLDRLKQDISLQRLTEGMGVALKRHGADLVGLCPFHEDRDPPWSSAPRRTSGPAWGPAKQAVR